MAKKIPLVVVITLMLVTAALTVVVTVGVYKNEYNKMIGDLPKRAAQYALLQEADELIRSHYYGQFSGGSVDASVIDGLVQSLDDPRSTYLTADEYQQRQAQAVAASKSDSVTYTVTGKIGYVRIVRLDETTVALFREAIESFDASEVSGFVLDLRNTANGDLNAAVELIDVIVPLATEGNGAIAVTRNVAGESIEIFSADSESLSYPISVLINSNTEGPAELIAADLRDFGKAKLFGEKTVGHGTLQEIFEMSDGGAIQLTVAEIFSYISGSYDGTGVKPDETVLLDPADKDALFSPSTEINDTQYAAAASAIPVDA